jgi:hypothetical protein
VKHDRNRILDELISFVYRQMYRSNFSELEQVNEVFSRRINDANKKAVEMILKEINEAKKKRETTEQDEPVDKFDSRVNKIALSIASEPHIASQSNV